MNGNSIVCGLLAVQKDVASGGDMNLPIVLLSVSNVENAISFRPVVVEESTHLVKTVTEVVKASKCRK